MKSFEDLKSLDKISICFLKIFLSSFYDTSLYINGESVLIFVHYFEGSNISAIVAGRNGAGDWSTQLRNPTDVYVTQGDSISDGKLSKFTSDNTTEQILLSGLSIPSDVILDECGHMFVAEAGKHRIVRYSSRLGGAVEVMINKRGMSGSSSEHL